jgi:hypothetical protein
VTAARTRQPQPGIRAFMDGTCPRCDDPIVRNVSRIVAVRGEWRHVGCVSGADE